VNVKFAIKNSAFHQDSETENVGTGWEDSERNVQMGILLENAPEHEKRVDDSVFQSRTELKGFQVSLSDGYHLVISGFESLTNFHFSHVEVPRSG